MDGAEVTVTGPGMEDTVTTTTTSRRRHTTKATTSTAPATAPVTVTTQGRPNSLYRRWPSTKAQATHQALMKVLEEDEEELSPFPPPPNPYRPSSSGTTLKSALIAGGVSLVAIGLAIMIRRRSWRSDYSRLI